MGFPKSIPSVLARDARSVGPASNGRAVVIGNFDGVHEGHRRVLERAAKPGQSLAVLTFEPHPAAVLRGSAPPRLTRLSRKVELLARLGVDLVVAQRFDAEFAALTPEQFVDRILVAGLGASRVCVGDDFRFGAKRAGDLEALRALAATRGFEVEVQGIVADARGPLSSTRARASIAAGDLDDARAVLGRPHMLQGRVVEGDRRGRTIGVPTANLAEIEEALPANGVHAVVVDRAPKGNGAEWRAFAKGVANVGTRPTIAGGEAPTTVEVHLFDLAPDESDLYGDALRVHLVTRLREEKRFPGLDALRAQIADDAAKARAILDASTKPERGVWY